MFQAVKIAKSKYFNKEFEYKFWTISDSNPV